MAIFFAASTNGFYDDTIHTAEQIPADAVGITSERHAELLEAQSTGKQISADTDGYPVAILPPPAPAVVPQQVTRFQARAALYQAGLLDDVEAMMADPKTDRMTVLAWQDAQAFKRTSPMVLDMAGKLGLDDKQLDGLFTAAAAIE